MEIWEGVIKQAVVLSIIAALVGVTPSAANPRRSAVCLPPLPRHFTLVVEQYSGRFPDLESISQFRVFVDAHRDRGAHGLNRSTSSLITGLSPYRWSTPIAGGRHLSPPLACRDAEIEGAKMPHRSKLRTEQHMIDTDGQRLLKEKMPKAWVLREYRPDYGLDYAVEAFCESGVDQLGKARYETLGEHFFIQLKSCRATKRGSLEIFGRDNVEKTPEKLNFDDRVGNLETIRLSIETPELVTVQRMGAAVPVLLVVADLGAASCYFLCLNDYIDKVLVPRHGNYTDAGTRTVHIPTRNELDGTESARKALRWYSKRPKLYAAFMKFFYQERELQYARNGPDFDETAKYFAQLICAYDFWDDVEMCTAIGRYGTALRLFLETGSPGLMTTRSEVLDRIAGGSVEQREFLQEQFRRDEVAELWRLLSTLPRIYEDVWREWLLPTALGYATSF